MTTYFVSGTTSENSVPAANLIILYKAYRGDLTSFGEELSRVVAQGDGKFKLTYEDWSKDVMVIALDPDPNRYDAFIEDWVVGAVVGVDPYIEDVVALLHMEGGNGGTAFLDEIGNVVTVAGDANTSTVQAKWGSSSAAFDGSGNDRVIVARSPDMSVGVQDFCIECWVFKTTDSGYQTIVCKRDVLGGPDVYGEFILRTNVATMEVFFRTGASTWVSNLAAGSAPLGQWFHLAVSREDSQFRVFIDGDLTGSFSSALTIVADSYDLSFGSETDDTAPLNGYIDDFRMTVGQARYTSDFIIPSEEFPNDVDPYFSDVAVLLHMDGADGGSVFTDVIGNAVAVSGITTTTDQIKFGISSGKFLTPWTDLAIAHTPALSLGFSDFTVECWVYNTQTAGAWTYLVSKGPLTSTTGEFDLSLGDTSILNDRVRLRVKTVDGTVTVESTIASPLNEWFHLAGVRYGSKIILFLNGEKMAETSVSSPVEADSEAFRVGTGSSASAANPYVYMDDVRYTVGVARYTQPFTPRQLAFPDA